jgi:hypothetical protein
MENESLVLDLLEWIGASGRSYEDVMAAWRTSCPRLTIWEDAVDAGFLAVRAGKVSVTKAGRNFLGIRRSSTISWGEEDCVT